MSAWEMSVFVAMVVAAFAIVVGVVWRMQWRRDPERFKDGFRRSPPPGSDNHWNRPR